MAKKIECVVVHKNYYVAGKKGLERIPPGKKITMTEEQLEKMGSAFVQPVVDGESVDLDDQKSQAEIAELQKQLDEVSKAVDEANKAADEAEEELEKAQAEIEELKKAQAEIEELKKAQAEAEKSGGKK